MITKGPEGNISGNFSDPGTSFDEMPPLAVLPQKAETPDTEGRKL